MEHAAKESNIVYYPRSFVIAGATYDLCSRIHTTAADGYHYVCVCKIPDGRHYEFDNMKKRAVWKPKIHGKIPFTHTVFYRRVTPDDQLPSTEFDDPQKENEELVKGYVFLHIIEVT